MAKNKSEQEPEVIELVADDSAKTDDTGFSYLPEKVGNTNSQLSATEVLHADSLKRVIENYLQYYASGAGHTARAKRYDLQACLRLLARYVLRCARCSAWLF